MKTDMVISSRERKKEIGELSDRRIIDTWFHSRLENQTHRLIPVRRAGNEKGAGHLVLGLVEEFQSGGALWWWEWAGSGSMRLLRPGSLRSPSAE